MSLLKATQQIFRVTVVPSIKWAKLTSMAGSYTQESTIVSAQSDLCLVLKRHLNFKSYTYSCTV